MPLLSQVQRLSLYSSSADSCLMQHHVCSPCVTQDRDNLSSNHTGLNDTHRIAKSESGTVSVLGSLLVAVNKKTVLRELSCSRKTEVFFFRGTTFIAQKLSRSADRSPCGNESLLCNGRYRHRLNGFLSAGMLGGELYCSCGNALHLTASL